jgi:hypothetical protein
MNILSTFIKQASTILGDTNTGLSGSKIAEIMSSYAYDLNVEIPYRSYPFPKDLPNKRTALYKNLLTFSSTQQYKILKELCELSIFKDNKDAKDLKIKLISRYGENFGYSIPEEVDKSLLDATNTWLTDYPDSKKIFEQAMVKLENRIFERNLLDDLRLSLELLIKAVLGNNKSIENQLADLGRFFRKKSISKELNNMIVKLINYFAKYQNTYVKHNDNVNDKEIEFIFELTSSLMKLLIRLA